MSEWFKELVLKTSDIERCRGFESHLLRHYFDCFSVGEVPKYGWRGSPAKGVERAKRCEGSNPSFSAMSEQSSFCSGFFIYGEKQAIRPLLCSYSFSKSSARLRACSVGNTLMTAPCRYQLLANSRVYLSLWKTIISFSRGLDTSPQDVYRLRQLFYKSRRRAHSAASPFPKKVTLRLCYSLVNALRLTANLIP